MIHGALVLRPEPGNAQTASRLMRRGVDVLRCPLFAVSSVFWTPPDPSRFDALLLTSANAVRHGEAELASLRGLPVLSVGDATAVAARKAGLHVAFTGERDGAALVAAARANGWTRLLHLAGRDRTDLPGAAQVTVYASETLPIASDALAAFTGRVALLHSRRAACRFAGLIDEAGSDRARIAIAALSEAVARAAGEGWAALRVADAPNDERLVDATCALIDPRLTPADKRRQ